MLQWWRERAAQDYSRLAEGAATMMAQEPCGRCASSVLALQLRVCLVCKRRICSSCAEREVVASELVDLRLEGKEVVGSEGSRAVCASPCLGRCVEAKVCAFRKALTESHVANVQALLQDDDVECFARPGAASARTGAKATAKRLAPLAVEALKLTGYGTVVTAYQAGSFGALVLTPQTRLVCERVVPVVRRHFFKAGGRTEEEDKSLGARVRSSLSNSTLSEASELALRLYYLGCSTAADRLEQRPQLAEGLEDAASHVAQAGNADWMGAAQWLYCSRELQPPHDGPDWAAWYCDRLGRQDGWRLVACVGASRSEDTRCFVPTRPPTPFPAWCLAARPADKTAVLAIRGSITQSDWLVNSNVATQELDGCNVHAGMLAAARAILDDCGARQCLDLLRGAGYTITVVGHSLGAGVATLITLLDDHVTCVAYAPPPCVSEELAQRLEQRVLSVVHRDDLVPRLSDANCAVLAKDLVADDANFKRRLAVDRKCIADRIRTLGKANAMRHDGDESPSAPSATDDSSAAKDVRAEPAGDEVVVVKLVVPGSVLYLKGLDASYQAVVGTHATLANELGRIVASSHAVDDHAMEAYLGALRTVRWTAPDFVLERLRPPPFLPAARLDEDSVAYAPCAVCGSDVTWTSFAPGSDAARAASTHHCRACARVVCCFCAPAGDVVPGDGIASTIRLHDRRLSLPSLGYFAPVRVCIPCYFKSFAL